MNENEEYIADRVRTWVWSGFYSPADINSMMEDIMEPDADGGMLARLAESELEAKREAEASWSPITDCDRLDMTFDALNNIGVVALHNAGFTMSDGYTEVAEALVEFDRGKVRGYCFYHEQDVARAVQGGGLCIAFGDSADTAEGKVAVGRFVKEQLERQGLRVE